MVGGAALAWACVPSSYLWATPQYAAPGGSITINGQEFDGGAVSLRWGSSTGPVLAVAADESFSQSVSVPSSAAEGIYLVFAVSAGGEMNRTPVEVKSSSDGGPSPGWGDGGWGQQPIDPGPKANPTSGSAPLPDPAPAPAPAPTPVQQPVQQAVVTSAPGTAPGPGSSPAREEARREPAPSSEPAVQSGRQPTPQTKDSDRQARTDAAAEPQAVPPLVATGAPATRSQSTSRHQSGSPDRGSPNRASGSRAARSANRADARPAPTREPWTVADDADALALTGGRMPGGAPRSTLIVGLAMLGLGLLPLLGGFAIADARRRRARA